VKDFCDIAGKANKDTGSSVNVLRTYRIFPGWKLMGLQQSLSIYNRLLQKRNQWGAPIYQIDKDCCPMLFTASYGGYRYPVEGEPGFGGDEPLKGPAGGNFDHICFAAGTKIATEKGEIPIEKIRIGDRVWTRRGLKKVIWSGMTSSAGEVNEYKFSTGRKFWATKNHRIWTCQNGWKELYYLSNDDTLCELNQSNTEESFIEDTRIQNKNLCGIILGPQAVKDIYTGESGWTQTGRFLKDFKFTIKTKTLLTIICRIWSVFQLKNTCGGITPGNALKSSEGIFAKFVNLQKDGTRLREGEFGTQNTERRVGKIAVLLSGIVNFVANYMRLGLGTQKQDFVQEDVKLPREGKQGLMMLKEFVPCVAEDIRQAGSTPLENTGVRFVGRSSLAKIVPTYNIEVDEEHEYFAEGVLVSNCDASRYAKYNCLVLLRAEAEAAEKAVGVWAQKHTENPKRRDW
jgi:hypothetical protein